VYDGAVRLVWPRAILALLAVLIATEIAVVAPRRDTVFLVAAAAWMAFAGVVLARSVLRTSEPSGILAWLVGPALGFGFSVFGVFLVWAGGVQNFTCLAVGPVLSLLIAAVVRRVGAPVLRLPRFDRRDVAAVGIALLVVPLIT
jgi:hypothetical protein